MVGVDDPTRCGPGYCYVTNSGNNWVATFFSAEEYGMPSVITGSDGSVVEGACGSFEQ